METQKEFEIYGRKKLILPYMKLFIFMITEPHPKVRIVLSHLSCVPLFATLWTVAHQAPLSMGFSRQEYWSGLPCPPPGNLPDPGIKPVSLRSSANWWVDSLPLAPPGKPLVQNRHLVFIET